MKNSLSHILNFVKENWPLALFGGLVVTLYLFVDKFAELIYGGFRFVVVILVSFAVISLVFKSTARPYIGSGDFANDFSNPDTSEKKFKVSSTILLIIAITWFATKCFVSP
jgi:MFS superfamily sulfate permease-like transporter